MAVPETAECTSVDGRLAHLSMMDRPWDATPNQLTTTPVPQESAFTEVSKLEERRSAYGSEVFNIHLRAMLSWHRPVAVRKATGDRTLRFGEAEA